VTKPKQSERVIQRSVRGWLISEGFEVIKLTTMRQYGTVGWPDLLVLDMAKFPPLFMEIKTETGKLTPLQKEKHRILRERGYTVCIIRSLPQAREVVESWIRSGRS